ncbi:SDR family NAD(P)-dependent oxidoreductase [Nocardia carnea]|uniref:SDR family NAD(P)-dependent oxidoreductase n=1 Tax=Nocardia carnea TaxID=37328 RepID=UPI0024538FC9|nr:SDR family oxidoreductase [Nocardia carnea]
MTARVAVVTGGASGIGRATCDRFTDLGWQVVVADRIPLGSRPRDARDAVLDVQADITDEGDIARLVAATAERFGRVDAVVTSAGIARNAPVRETTPETFRHTLEVNLVATFTVVRAFLDLLAADGGGSVVTVSSVSGLRGSQDRAAYSASKGGVVALTGQLAFELAEEGIRVNCVAPGSTLTPLARSAQGRGAKEEILKAIPLRRYAEPAEIAEVITFLAGPRAGFVTGQTWTVDGGQSIGAGWRLPKGGHSE